MTEEEKAVERLRKEVKSADKYGWQSFRVPKECIRTLLAAYERRSEVLETIVDGYVPRAMGVVDRERCIHDVWLNEDCGDCIEIFARAGLNQETHHG